MKIIPVIDLQNGIVVSARHGDRDNYAPITSHLSSSGCPLAVLNGFLSLFPFDIVYIADLNAICNKGSNQTLIQSILLKYPDIRFWVDDGKCINNIDQPLPNWIPVIGSESQNSIKSHTMASNNDYVLSLDFFPEKGYQGPKWLLENSKQWPDHVIIMTLANVGNNKGPDFKLLETFNKHYPETIFIAAGGIRNEQDLEQLSNLGIKHALLASALHRGVIKKEIINRSYKNALVKLKPGH